MFRFARGSAFIGKNVRFRGARWESTTTGAAAGTGAEQSFVGKVWQTIRSKITVVHMARAVRVGALGIAIYQAGYQAGLITYAQDPHKIEKGMMAGVIAAAGAENYHPVYHPQHIQVKRVGESLIFAAKQMCKEKINTLTAENKTLEHMINENNKDTKTAEAAADARHKNFELREKLNQNKEALELWETAHSRLKGSWHYVVIDVPTVNAFVTAACPRRVFVHSGLITKLNPTDDELALVMGHEISHFLLQHVEKEQSVAVFLKIAQLVLLTFVEPIGFFSLAYDYLLAKIAEFVDASYSRECEEEADTLGIELTARACYDTRKSIRIFEKLDYVTHQHNLTPGGLPQPLSIEAQGSQPTPVIEEGKKNDNAGEVAEDPHTKEHAAWNDSHPSWDDRLDNVRALSEKYNPQKYSTCTSYLKKYIDSLSASKVLSEIF